MTAVATRMTGKQKEEEAAAEAEASNI